MPLFESDEIKQLQGVLNSKELAPRLGFRRDAVVYPLVCYVNNITGCYLSKNIEPIPLFIERARIHMQEIPAIDEWFEYYGLVAKYLDLVENHLKDFGVDTKYL